MIQGLEDNLSSPVYDQAVQLVQSLTAAHRPGRQSTTTAATTVLALLATGCYRTERAALNELRDQKTWQRLRSSAHDLWPKWPDLWLPPACPSRDAHRRAVARLKAEGGFPELISLIGRDALDCVAEIIEAEPGAYTNPAPGNLVAGDGTFIRARTNFEPGSMGVRADGTEYPHRFDPRARNLRHKQKTDKERHLAPTDDTGRRPRATEHVLISVRNRFSNERVILANEIVPEGKGDAEVYVDWVVGHRAALPAITVGVYDMALLGVQADRLVGAGITPMTKIPLNKRGSIDSANLGVRPFHLNDGSFDSIPVYTIDGHSGILAHTDDEKGEEWWIPLRRGQVRRRTDTMYVDVTILDTPLVEPRLRGGRCALRLNSTIKESENHINVAGHLRAFPEQDPVFKDLFGLREDTESHHNKLKNHLWCKRARTTDPERNDLDLAIWQFTENNRARAAHRQRLSQQAAPAPPLLRTG